jgi:MFS family permease
VSYVHASTQARPRHRAALFAVFGANAISLTGNVLTALAVPWFVLETTGSAAKTGVSAFFTTVPAILAAFFGGAIVDRLGSKRMSVVADLASGVTVAAIPLLHHTVGLAFWHLLALVFLGALLDAPGETARSVLVPDLAEAAGMKLERVNAITQGISRGARMAGAPLAGVLIAVFGASTVLWVDAATFLVSALIVALLVPRPRLQPADEDESGPYFARVTAGLRFIRGNRLICTLVLLVAVTNFLDAPLMVLFPVYAREVYGSATALGLMSAASGGGALAGAIVFGVIGHRLRRRPTLIVGFIVAALPLWPLVLLPALPVMIVLRLTTGLGSAPLNPVLDTVFQERIPPALRGRVFGAISAMVMIAMPIGVLAGGLLIEQIGLRPTIVVVAFAYVAAAVSMPLFPVLREMDDRPATQPAGQSVALGEGQVA